MVCDFDLLLIPNIQFIRKHRKPTDASNTVELNLIHINLQVATLKIQLLVRPLSGSIKDSVGKTKSFGTGAVFDWPEMPHYAKELLI